MKLNYCKISECYLLVLFALAGYTPPFTFNPIVILGAILMLFHIKNGNKTVGLILGILFSVINLYFLGAVLSEFNEFETTTNKAKQLLWVGILIWITSAVSSSLMIYNYSQIRNK